jgi:hypothetical protein
VADRRLVPNVGKKIILADEMSLAEILDELPMDVSCKDVIFMTHEDYNKYYFKYTVSEKNINYEQEMKEWEVKKCKYDTDMIIYLKDKEMYDNWNNITEEERMLKIQEEVKDKKLLEIEKLEDRLSKLREEVKLKK